MSTLVERFRSGFRRHAAGVTIVVVVTDDGPVGATVSSVASVSADPPMLAFSVTRTGTTAAALAAGKGDRVAVFTLTTDQVAVAAAFAESAGERFTPAQGWSTRADGAPALAGAAATLRGPVAQLVPAGGSWLVLVAVDEVDEVDAGAAGVPLVYHDRAYWGLDALPVATALRAVEG